ncbi:MAG: hypothetical protein IJB27_07580 [Clostridia bacterium]|nr:hypothetical protein [Clostridia bacterium]
MKRIVCALGALTLLLTAAMPTAAVPYTEQELEEYMEAIYCEQVWAEDFADYQVQFIDFDFDGRYELVAMERGEEYAPKQASVYAFMDAELSGRGRLEIGKLEVCRDPDTHEPFVINRMEKDGRMFHQQLRYHADTISIGAHGVTEEYAARLEDYGYRPAFVTKEQFSRVKEYAQSRALFMDAHQNTVYENGEPPIVEPEYGDSASTYTDNAPPEDLTGYWIGGGVVAVGVIAATVAFGIVRRKAKTAKSKSKKSKSTKSK